MGFLRFGRAELLDRKAGQQVRSFKVRTGSRNYSGQRADAFLQVEVAKPGRPDLGSFRFPDCGSAKPVRCLSENSRSVIGP